MKQYISRETIENFIKKYNLSNNQNRKEIMECFKSLIEEAKLHGGFVKIETLDEMYKKIKRGHKNG